MVGKRDSQALSTMERGGSSLSSISRVMCRHEGRLRSVGAEFLVHYQISENFQAGVAR